ncbi:MAG: SPFH domain-containing protein, partial [Gemmatimonadales bacterium]|nr:SPFH domain-containing protein [Gemmatimonadales bacterium]
MVRERILQPSNGYLALALLLATALGAIVFLVRAAQLDRPLVAIGSIVLLVVVLVCLAGLFVVNPNEARVLTLFGEYTGSVKASGFHFANPFAIKHKISLRVRNFETTKLKVNDAHSNPIEIAAIVVWRVTETAEAMFEVDHYVEYVSMQSESALRALAQSYPYDAHQADEVALSTHTAEVSRALREALV